MIKNKFEFEDKEYEIRAWEEVQDKETSGDYKIRVFHNNQLQDYYKYDISFDAYQSNNNLLEDMIKLAEDEIRQKKHLLIKEHNKSEEE